MNRLADVAQMLVHTPYLGAALAFTFVALAVDAWMAGRETHTGADEPRS